MLLQGPVTGPAPVVRSGRLGQITVSPPRLAGGVVVDGVLDEPQWKAASVLTGFSELTPVDGVPAADSTEIRIWYSSTALYVGVHAFDRAGAVHATLATRDQIANDDNVQIYLSTFNDGRQATFFAVNPLGVQADGALNENGTLQCSGPTCGAVVRQQPDLSQDFVWDSKGQLTPDGYVVEIRIPFRSIRFQSERVQSWGINIVRVVQRSGQEQTWTPVRQGASSFLAQSGRLDSLTGLESGHVLDLVPSVTSRVDGAPRAPGQSFDYQMGRPQVGGDVRYGLTPNLTLHAAAHPDFSQVESDVTQFSFDPRQAVYYPERRPFFLDGTEQFDAPSSLIYTRRIVQPVFAGKIAGKVGDNQIGFLAAVDDRAASVWGDNPVFAILRATHDLGPGSRLGIVWTEQHDGSETNRVLGADGRIVVGGINSFTFNGALAYDEVAGAGNTSPLWAVGYRRDGQHFRANYSVSGISPDFVTRSGFVTQPGVGSVVIDHSYTWLWPHRTIESFTTDLTLNGVYHYDDLVRAGPILNRHVHLNLNARLKGGWTAGAGFFPETFGYDPSIYANYGIRHPDGTITPFTGGGMRLPNRDYDLSFGTPIWRHFDLNVFGLAGLDDENFPEWASGKVYVFIASTDFRPTDHLRLNVAYNDSRVYRPSDGSRVLLQSDAVATLEYQLSRAFQLRLIGQYSINARDSLRDDSRTGLPIVIRDPTTGVYAPTVAYSMRQLQLNFLFSYLPTPGTVLYFGYGATAARPDDLGQPVLHPVQASFFLKLSYLWRRR